VRIKDLWQWDRETSRSSGTATDESGAGAGAEAKIKSNREMVQAKPLPSRKRTAPNTTLEGDDDKKPKNQHSGLSSSAHPEFSNGTKSAPITRTPVPPLKPNCFSEHKWESLKSQLHGELRYGEWAYHCKKKTMWWSASLYKVFEMEPDKKTGRKLSDYATLIHPDDRDLLHFLFDRAVKIGAGYTVTHRCLIRRTPQIKVIWCRCKCTVHYGGKKGGGRLNMPEASSDDHDRQKENHSERYLVGLVQDVTRVIRDSDCSKSYMNNPVPPVEHTRPLAKSEIESANTVCELS